MTNSKFGDYVRRRIAAAIVLSTWKRIQVRRVLHKAVAGKLTTSEAERFIRYAEPLLNTKLKAEVRGTIMAVLRREVLDAQSRETANAMLKRSFREDYERSRPMRIGW